jgi:predicted ATPase
MKKNTFDEATSELSSSARIETNWYVITGGPSSGKTTVVNELRKRGYKTMVEDARHYIDLQRAEGKSLGEIKKNRRIFQRKVLELQIAQERSLSPSDIVFLDRAIPDTRAYCQFLDLPEDDELEKLIRSVFYRKIFILDLLPLVEDYARREDEAAQKAIHELLIGVYRSLPFPIVYVPVLPVEQRVDLILASL